MYTNNKWQALSMRDRAFLIREAVRNGITDINSIRDTWEHRFDGTKDNIPTEDKVSESYIHNFPYVRTALELPHQTEDDIQYRRQHFKYSPEFISQVQSGDYILSKMSNFSKNDSLVYTPLLERLDTYFKNRYDKEYNAQAPSEQEKVNQRYATWMIANMLDKKANPYNEKHKFINDKLTSLPDDEIDKLFNVTYYGPKASLIKGLKAKPKNITIPELIKMYKIMNQEYFHEKSDYNPLHQFSGEEPNIFTDTWDTVKGWFNKKESIEQKPTTAGPVDLDELKIRQSWAESRFRDNVVSPAGATGRFQVMPNVKADYIKAGGRNGNLKDPRYNEEVRDWQMEQLAKRSWINKEGSTDSVKVGKQLAAYNYGPTNLVNALNKAKVAGIDIYKSFDWVDEAYLPKETVDYVNWTLRNKSTGVHRNDSVYNLNKHKYSGEYEQSSDDTNIKETSWYLKLAKSLSEGARMARDARIGNPAAQMVRDLYDSGEKQKALDLAKSMIKANSAGIALGAGAASTSLLADLGITAGTTVMDTVGDGNSENLAKNVAKNAIGDLLGFGAGKALNHFIDLNIIKKAFKDGRLRIGDPVQLTGYHQSNSPITDFVFPYKERWDVVTHKADPSSAFFTIGNPASSGFLSKRPYTGQFSIKMERPLIQTGEINGTTKNTMRNKIVKAARKLGADGVLYEGIADNQLENQRILQAFENAGINHINTDVNYANLSDSQWDELYNKALAENNLAEAQRLRDLHFKTKSPDNVFINPDGTPAVNYHGSPETFNEFNINLFGRTDPGDHGVGFYFSPDKEYAEWYGQTRPFYLYAKNPYIGKHSSMLNRGKNAQELIAKHKIDTDKAAERSIQHMLQQQMENTPSKMYEAFGFTGETSEKEIRDAVKKYYNGVHNDYVRSLGNIDVADSYKSIDENVIFNPNHIKISDPISYDDTGNTIPLSKRDNFSISDTRYSLLPFAGLGTSLFLPLTNKLKQEK